jgi:hypothetical protein
LDIFLPLILTFTTLNIYPVAFGRIMEEILSRGKDYEQLVLRHDAAYNDVVAAIAIVKEFIIKHKLIVYGGTAIDYALRLHGDSIYNDKSLATPDLDFYSPTHAEHAYELADILYKAGFGAARAIVATYQRTMRVDVVDNHFVADISYIPAEIFEQLPYLEYENMRIIHPDFQRIDVHSALSIPYGNPPTEDIFSRWKKDIERFNKLAKYYPIDAQGGGKQSAQIPLKKVILGAEYKKYVFTGIAAYSAIYTHYVKLMSDLGAKIDQSVPPAEFIVEEIKTGGRNNKTTNSAIMNGIGINITFTTYGELEIVHMDLVKVANELHVGQAEYYEPYISVLSEMLTGTIKLSSGEMLPLRVMSIHNKLISCNSIEYRVGFNQNDSIKIRITNVQYLLKYFLSMYFKNKLSPTSIIYLKYYNGLMTMIETLELALLAAEKPHLAAESPLFPSLEVYGSDNKSLSYEVNMLRIKADIENGPKPIIPMNYYPERARGHPTFDYSTSPIFAESGKQIKKSDDSH